MPQPAPFGLLFFVSAVGASDLEKERRWENQITDALLEGEAIHLEDSRSRFLAIETPSADGNRDKVAIIMHGTGVHPDWPTVVHPLRVGLPQLGWNTLSIQMPVLANDAEHSAYASLYDRVPERLDAAIQHARESGAKTLVLIGHSQGSTMAAYYLAQGDEKLDGFIAIGMGAGASSGPMDNLSHLMKIRLPMLDLFGSEDLPGVIDSAAQRAKSARQVNNRYQQIQVSGADHFFEGEEELLLRTVDTWLTNNYLKR